MADREGGLLRAYLELGTLEELTYATSIDPERRETGRKWGVRNCMLTALADRLELLLDELDVIDDPEEFQPARIEELTTDVRRLLEDVAPSPETPVASFTAGV